MSTFDQLVPLGEDDRRILLARKQAGLRLAIVKVLLAVLVLVPLLYFRHIYFLVALPLFSVMLSLYALASFLQFTKAKADLDQGQKRIITGSIEAQDVDVTRQTDSDGVESSATYNFWVQVGGQKLTVSEDLYYQLKKGDQVEAEVAPDSDIVFRINKFSEIA